MMESKHLRESLKVIGTPLDCEPTQFVHVSDIEWFEGPLLALFQTANSLFMCKWHDRDDQYNRWIMFSITQEDLDAYFQKEVTLLTLLRKPRDNMYLVDVDTYGNWSRWYAVTIDTLAEEFLPTENSFYDETLRPPNDCC